MGLSSEIVLFSGNSPAGAATSAASAVAGFKDVDKITIIANLLGAAGGALDVYIQDSPDGVTWYDYVHYTQLASGASAISYAYSPNPFNDTIKTIGRGTSPVLAANSVRGGHWYDQLRVLFVAAGGAAAAAQDIRVLAVRN